MQSCAQSITKRNSRRKKLYIARMDTTQANEIQDNLFERWFGLISWESSGRRSANQNTASITSSICLLSTVNPLLCFMRFLLSFFFHACVVFLSFSFSCSMFHVPAQAACSLSSSLLSFEWHHSLHLIPAALILSEALVTPDRVIDCEELSIFYPIVEGIRDWFYSIEQQPICSRVIGVICCQGNAKRRVGEVCKWWQRKDHRTNQKQESSYHKRSIAQ